jgi:HEAT repeat protein
LIGAETKLRVQARLELVERAWNGHEPAWVLEEALGDEELTVRERAAAAAAEVLEPQRLVELISNPANLSGRAAAMVALRRAGERSLPALESGVRSGDQHTGIFCLQVLGRIRSPKALAILREAARSSDVLLVQTAIEALGHQKDLESVDIILEAVDKGPWLAFSAILALGEIGDPRAVSRLEELRTRDPMLAETIDQALERICPKRRADA